MQRTDDEWKIEETRLRAELDTMRIALDARQAAMATFERLAAQARAELATPFGQPTPTTDAEAESFLARRAYLKAVIADVKVLAAQWVGEQGQPPGAFSLLQTALMRRSAAVDEAAWMTDPRRAQAEKEAALNRFIAMQNGSLPLDSQ